MLNNKGQSLIGILIVLVIIGAITGGLYFYFSKQIPEIPEVTEKPAKEEGTSPKTEVEYWAVIFGAPGGTGEPDGFDDIPMVLKDILLQYGWKEDHIRYFAGENAIYANVITAFDWLANNTDPNDVVLFHSMSHGSSDGIYLNDDRYLGFSELAEKFDRIKYRGMIIIIDACYSGGAIPVFKKENRVIITSARSNEIADAVLSQRLLAALQGFGDIEGNNNEWVSAEETFNFIQTRYPGPQSLPWPQIQDDYPGELNILFLDGYWRYLDQFNIGKSKHSFNSSAFLGGNPLDGSLDDVVYIYAQSFKPNYPILTKAMLGVHFGSGKPGPLTVSVRKDLSGSDLTSATLNRDVIRLFSSELYEFDFPDIEVMPNETYYLVINVSHADEKGDYYNLWVDIVGGYPRGTMFFKSINPPISWIDSLADSYFATFGKPK